MKTIRLYASLVAVSALYACGKTVEHTVNRTIVQPAPEQVTVTETNTPTEKIVIEERKKAAPKVVERSNYETERRGLLKTTIDRESTTTVQE